MATTYFKYSDVANDPKKVAIIREKFMADLTVKHDEYDKSVLLEEWEDGKRIIGVEF